MSYYSLPSILIASICFYVGMYYLLVFMKRKKERSNLTFAYCCFAVCIYNISCFGLYNTATVAQGMQWQRWNFTGIALISSSLSIFIPDLIGKKINIVIKILNAFFFMEMLVALFYTGDLGLSLAHPMPRTVDVMGIFSVTYHEVQPGILLVSMFLTGFVCMTYMLYYLIDHYRKRRERSMLLIIMSIVLFYFTVTSDSLAASGVYSMIYLVEYSYLIIILAMSYAMLTRFVDLHNQVEELNAGLELKVLDRTEQLEAAMYELSAMNGELIEARDALWGEMMIAKKIQTVLLPDNPTITDYEIAAVMNPADEVGGDYYDVINADGMDWIVIGDVSGHGVPAGLIMMMVQTAIRVALSQNPGSPPSELLATVNKTITRNIQNFREDKYMTITVLAVHRNGEFAFSGLHLDILIYRSDSATVQAVETNGLWLGILENLHRSVQNDTIQLRPGDVMLLYTDGITEAVKVTEEKNNVLELYGEERLTQSFLAHGSKPVEEIRACILEDLKGFRQRDDLTLLVVRRIR